MSKLVTIKKIKPNFLDDRGTISDIIVGEHVRHIGIITSKANTIRGTHYHKSSTQYNYITKGKIELLVKDAKDKSSSVERHVLEAGDLVKIPPLVIHSLKAILDSEFLVFTSEYRRGNDYEKDTVRVNL